MRRISLISLPTRIRSGFIDRYTADGSFGNMGWQDESAFITLLLRQIQSACTGSPQNEPDALADQTRSSDQMFPQ